MRGISIFLAVVLAAAVASAAEPIILFDVSDGAYVLRVSGSQVSLIPARSVSPVGPVIPPDGPVVPPVIPAGKVEAIKAAAEAAVADPQRATTASNLASAMGLVRSQVDAGALKDYQTISASVNWLWDQLTTGKAAAWQPCKTLIGQHLAALAQEGARPEEYSGYLADAERALSGSLTADERLEVVDDPLAINMDTLMKLFEFFVKYILPLLVKI